MIWDPVFVPRPRSTASSATYPRAAHPRAAHTRAAPWRAAVLAVGLLPLLAGCFAEPQLPPLELDPNTDPAGCTAEDQVPAQPRAVAPFSFTDAQAKTVTRPVQPTRIIADEYSAAALLALGVVPVGIWSPRPLEESAALRCLDIAEAAWVSKLAGGINPTAVSALKPDLIVGQYTRSTGSFTGLDDAEAATLRGYAPLVAIERSETSSLETIANYEELVDALGVDREDQPLADARADFDAATVEFRSALRGQGRLRVAALWPWDNALVRDDTVDPDLSDLDEWGLQIVSTPGYPSRLGWFEVPYEEVDSALDIDIALLYRNPDETEPYPPSGLADRFPALSQVPAVRAGQLIAWDPGVNVGYRRYAKTLRAYAHLLSLSHDVTS